MLQAILQSKVTVLLLTSLSVLTAAKQYLGDPIHCIFDARSGVKTEAIDAFCWIHATFPLDPSLIEKLSNLPGRGIRVVFYTRQLIGLLVRILCFHWFKWTTRKPNSRAWSPTYQSTMLSQSKPSS